jgi:hypothetical protein
LATSYISHLQRVLDDEEACQDKLEAGGKAPLSKMDLVITIESINPQV